MSPPEVHFESIHFSGHVQGVGFRYSVLQVAKEYDISGVVQNLTDGRVLLELEGTLDDISQMVAAIEERMDGYVRGVERSASKRVAQFSGFSIR